MKFLIPSIILGASLSVSGCLLLTGTLLRLCGDGIINGDESCDDANNDPDDGCDQCVALVNAGCGDGALIPGEFCFDEEAPTVIADNAEGDLILADLGGDNLPDFAYSIAGGDITILENQSSNGDFVVDANTAAVGNNTTTVFQAVDLNGDADLDLLTGDNDAVGVVFGDGAFNFGGFVELNIITNDNNSVLAPTSALGFDVDGNGQLDVVGTTVAENGDSAVFIEFQINNNFNANNTDEGIFGEDLFSIVQGSFGFAAVASDNIDNLLVIPDLTVIDDTDLLAIGDIGVDPVDLVIADLDGNNDDDLIAAGSDGVTISLNDNDTFTEGANFAIGAAVSLAISDIDQDGNDDIVAAVGSDIVILRGDANNLFIVDNTLIFNAGGTITAVQVGDLNDDAGLDVAALTSAGLVIFLNRF